MSGVPENWPEDWAVPTVSMRDMFSALRIESAGIVRRQKDLVASGVLDRPDEGMLKRALAMHRAEQFLIDCSPYMGEVKSTIERLRLKGPRP